MVQFLVEVISLHRNHLLCLNVTILCDNAKFYFLRKGNEGEKGDKGEPVCFHSSLSSLPLMKNILCFFCVTVLIILPCCSPSHPPARPWLPDLRIGAFCNKAGLLCAPPLTAATFFQHFYSLWRESCRASVRCLIFFFLSAPQFFWHGCWRHKGETWTSGTASKQILSRLSDNDV